MNVPNWSTLPEKSFDPSRIYRKLLMSSRVLRRCQRMQMSDITKEYYGLMAQEDQMPFHPCYHDESIDGVDPIEFDVHIKAETEKIRASWGYRDTLRHLRTECEPSRDRGPRTYAVSSLPRDLQEMIDREDRNGPRG